MKDKVTKERRFKENGKYTKSKTQTFLLERILGVFVHPLTFFDKFLYDWRLAAEI